MIVNLLLILVFLAIALVLAREGLWSGLVMLLNIVAAATFATAWFERLAGFLDAKMPSYTYLIDFLCLWGIFAVVLLVMRLITDRVSTTKVKFLRHDNETNMPAVYGAGAARVERAETASRGRPLGWCPSPRWRPRRLRG